MIDKIKRLAAERGAKLAAVPYARMQTLKQDIEAFARDTELNGFQKYILEGIYRYEFDVDFEPKSVIVMAIPHPFCVDLTLEYGGKRYPARQIISAKGDDFGRYIADAIKEAGYSCGDATSAPLKRLAVCSGLAEYGRTNITYVEGMGSTYGINAFVTDIPCEDNWREMKVAEMCEGCGACVAACPTHAIREDAFLLDNINCLSCINEFEGDEFPDWIPAEAHHSLYDCLLCQEACPMNADAVNAPREQYTICEADVQALLDGKSEDALTPEFREMAKRMDLFRWSAGLPRNIRALLR